MSKTKRRREAVNEKATAPKENPRKPRLIDASTANQNVVVRTARFLLDLEAMWVPSRGIRVLFWVTISSSKQFKKLQEEDASTLLMQ